METRPLRNGIASGQVQILGDPDRSVVPRVCGISGEVTGMEIAGFGCEAASHFNGVLDSHFKKKFAARNFNVQSPSSRAFPSNPAMARAVILKRIRRRGEAGARR